MADEPKSEPLSDSVVTALVRLAEADFSVRLNRPGDRSRDDVLAFLINSIAEELSTLWEEGKRHQAEQEATVNMVSEGLLALASGRFDWSTARSGDGSPRDVIAFLLNNTAEELSLLVKTREQQAAEVAMLRSARATERLAGMGALAAGAAHELATPLTSALLFLQEASDAARLEKPPSELLPLISTALEGVERAAVLLDDLRIFVRERPQTLEAVPLDSVIRGAVRLLQHEARSRCKVIVQTKPAAVRANEARLGQVFVNLLKNAIQAIEPGDPEHQLVSITTERVGDRVRVCIRDTGRGMSDEVAARAFEPFFTTKPVNEGTGLGLPVSLATVRELGGELSLRSGSGVGTVVTVELPLAPEATVASVSERDPASDTNPEPTAERPVVIVVDDDPVLSRALSRGLRHEYEVHSACSGEEALRLIAALQGGVDLVLCDVMMPQMTGIELQARIHQESPELAARFLFISGGGVTEHTRSFLEHLEGYVKKPVSQQQLIAAVRRALRSTRGRHAAREAVIE
ncbi:MAG TPA: ATP-binding protein [Polyangiaceae bacterium]|nr:ATP-binding protein [Polyangiaceae bacterium]